MDHEKEIHERNTTDNHVKHMIPLHFFLCIITLSACAGIGVCAVVSEWKYGGTNDDWGYALVANPDGTVFMAGITYSEDGDVTMQHGNGDLWAILVNSDGTKRWDRSYGGSLSEYALSAKPVSSGGYILCGTTGSEDGDISGYKGSGDGWIVRLDADGELIWSLVLGGTQRDELGDIIENPDGSFTAVGYTFSEDGDVSKQHGAGDAWVVWVSSSGELIRSMTYGGSQTDSASSLIRTDDGNFVILGTTHSPEVSQTYAGMSDVWIFSLTPQGDVLWSKTYGGSDGDWGHALCEKDGEYYIVAVTNSHDGSVSRLHGASDIWLLKLDRNGGLIFEKTFGGSFSDNAWDIKPMGDGLLIIGETYSVDGDVTNNRGDPAVWALFVNSSGNLLWEECLGGEWGNSGQRVWPIDAQNAWILSHSQTPPEEGGYGDYVLTRIMLPVLGSPLKTPVVPQAKVLIPLPGMAELPTDPDGDGLYEDLNGNGRGDFADLLLFFDYMEWISENEPIELFDYNRNGRIDLDDLQVLYAIITSQERLDDAS
jgi:PKD repeat protein